MNFRTIQHPRLITAGVIIVVILAIVTSFYTANRKLRVCPDAWYQNRMPSVSGTGNNEYFVYKEKRLEVADVDVAWIEGHCEVNKPSTVY